MALHWSSNAWSVFFVRNDEALIGPLLRELPRVLRALAGEIGNATLGSWTLVACDGANADGEQASKVLRALAHVLPFGIDVLDEAGGYHAYFGGDECGAEVARRLSDALKTDVWGYHVDAHTDGTGGHHYRCGAVVAQFESGRSDRAAATFCRPLKLDPEYLHDWSGGGSKGAELVGIEVPLTGEPGPEQIGALLALGPKSSATRSVAAGFQPDMLRRGMGLYQYRSGQAAIAALTEAIRGGPPAVENLVLRGLAHHRQENFALAIADYSQVLDLAPTDADIYFHRANACAALGRGKAALADVEKALSSAPADWPHMANAKKMVGKLRKILGLSGPEVEPPPELKRASRDKRVSTAPCEDAAMLVPAPMVGPASWRLRGRIWDCAFVDANSLLMTHQASHGALLLVSCADPKERREEARFDWEPRELVYVGGADPVALVKEVSESRDQSSVRARLWRISLQSGEKIQVPGPWEDHFAFSPCGVSPDGRFVAIDQWGHALHFLDTRSRHVESVKLGDRDSLRLLGWTGEDAQLRAVIAVVRGEWWNDWRYRWSLRRLPYPWGASGKAEYVIIDPATGMRSREDAVPPMPGIDPLLSPDATSRAAMGKGAIRIQDQATGARTVLKLPATEKMEGRTASGPPCLRWLAGSRLLLCDTQVSFIDVAARTLSPLPDSIRDFTPDWTAVLLIDDEGLLLARTCVAGAPERPQSSMNG